MVRNRTLDVSIFHNYALQGLNCKQIAKKMGYHSHSFGFLMKNILGIYPSVYIARLKNGKT